MEIIDKIRYDGFDLSKPSKRGKASLSGHKEHYNNNKLDYIQFENEKIFNNNGINDYYDKYNNYKICLLCYVKK